MPAASAIVNEHKARFTTEGCGFVCIIVRHA